MKDYSNCLKKLDTFILNYEIKKDKIKVNFSSKGFVSSYTIPYTVDNEKNY